MVTSLATALQPGPRVGAPFLSSISAEPRTWISGMLGPDQRDTPAGAGRRLQPFPAFLATPTTLKTKKSVATDDRRIHLERQALGLSRRCPVDLSNPGNCPLFGLRPFGIRERRAWIHRLSLEELEYLVCYHASCAAVRRAAGRPRKIRVCAAKTPLPAGLRPGVKQRGQ